MTQLSRKLLLAAGLAIIAIPLAAPRPAAASNNAKIAPTPIVQPISADKGDQFASKFALNSNLGFTRVVNTSRAETNEVAKVAGSTSASIVKEVVRIEVTSAKKNGDTVAKEVTLGIMDLTFANKDGAMINLNVATTEVPTGITDGFPINIAGSATKTTAQEALIPVSARRNGIVATDKAPLIIGLTGVAPLISPTRVGAAQQDQVVHAIPIADAHQANTAPRSP